MGKATDSARKSVTHDNGLMVENAGGEEKETELEMVRRHVREGAAHLVRQVQLVAALRDAGQPTQAEIAERLLAAIEDTQRQHEAHLARLEGRPADVP